MSEERKLKILIADDSYPNRMMLANVFKDEFDAILAENGGDAIVAMQSNDGIAVAIIDLYMPQHDGFAVLERMFRDPKLSQIPVLAVTTAEDISGQMRALDLGVAGVLTKPLNMQIVTHKVHNVIVRSLGVRTDERDYLFSHMYKQSELDEKTGLYNKLTFCREARKLIDEHPGERFVLFRWDLDGFKVLNDVYGVESGDRFLQQVGEMYLRTTRDLMVYGRWEADHFVTCMRLEDFNGRNIAERITKLEGFDNLPFEMTTRIGVYIIDDPSLDISLMCDRALMALRSIKGNYSQRVALYDATMRDELIEKQQLVNEMEDALNNGQFVVYLQPQYNYSSGLLHGAEALVRWIHPVKGIIPPAKFIPIFERNGFITHLDRYVWEEVCKLQRRWIDEGLETVPVSVNVSRTDILSLKLSEYFTELIRKYNLPTGAIRIEITESAYMDNPGQLISAVEKLQLAGFSVEMDDFGSGYSSLNSLKDVPVDLLKLDMKFISKGSNERRGGSILSSVVRMTNWLKLPVLAEGVETKAQAEYLKSIGCIYMQGFYFAKPMPPESYELLLKEKRIDTSRGDLYETNFESATEFLDTSNQATLIFNSFVGGAAIIEYDGREVEALRINDRFFEIVGATREQFRERGMHLLSDFDEVNRMRFINALDRAISTGNETDCQLVSYKTLEGKDLWTHARLRLLAVNAGKYLFYLAIENISDIMALITSNKQMADQMTAIVNNVPGGILDYEVRDGVVRMIYFNERLPIIFGFNTAEYHERFDENPYKALHPDDVTIMANAVDTMLNEDTRTLSVNVRHICKDATWKWVSFSASVTRRTQDSIYCTAIMLDVDDQTKAVQRAEYQEHETEKQKLLQREVFNAIPLGIILFSHGLSGFRLQGYNDAAWKLLEFDSEEQYLEYVEEHKYRFGIHEDDRERVEKAVWKIIAGSTGGTETVEFKMVTNKGNVKHVRNTIRKVIYSDDMSYIQYVFKEL